MAKSNRVVVWCALAAVLSVLFAYQTNAQQIFVQQSGTSPAMGDPNIISNTGSFTVGVAGGTFTEQSPLLIIVGVYNGVGTPSISFSGCATPSACPAAVVGTYGLTAQTATLGAGQDAYFQEGLQKGASEAFTNWSSGDTKDGFAAPTSFKLYAFALPTNLTSTSPITIDESGAAVGSFIIGYDCKNGTGSGSGCATNGDVGSTPFTNAGIVAAGIVVPEPATMLLFGTGLVMVGAKLCSRKSRNSAAA